MLPLFQRGNSALSLLKQEQMGQTEAPPSHLAPVPEGDPLDTAFSQNKWAVGAVEVDGKRIDGYELSGSDAADGFSPEFDQTKSDRSAPHGKFVSFP